VELDEIADDEQLWRFLNPAGNHITSKSDGSARATTAAFICEQWRTDPNEGTSVFVASRSDLQRLSRGFPGHGLATFPVSEARRIGFRVHRSPSDKFPDDDHALMMPSSPVTAGRYRAMAKQLTDVAVVSPLPAAIPEM
jgi:hypothetical protein